MPKEQYLKITSFKVLNEVTYDECLSESKISKKFDKSGTLFDLLRNALYKEEDKCRYKWKFKYNKEIYKKK